MRAMQNMGTRRGDPQLKQLVVEASQALARLDAGRLEELAMSCVALTRDLATAQAQDRAWVCSQAREASGQMAVFASVLAVTRENLNVMSRLRELREGRLEYSEGHARGWARPESGHGDN